MRTVETASGALGGLLFACAVFTAACTGTTVTNDTGSPVDGAGSDAARDAIDTGSSDATIDDATDAATDIGSSIDSSIDAQSSDGASSDVPSSDVPSSDAVVFDASSDGAPVDAGGTDSGPSPCERACDHVFTCTGITCAAFGVDCATTPVDECTGDCIAMTSCSMLGATTPMTCQAMCASDAGVVDAGTSDTGSTDAGSSDAGASPCERACDHVFECTGLTCSVLGVDCATTSVDECTGDCIATTPCGDLTGTTPMTCQMRCASDGGVADAASDVPATDAGGDRVACGNCSTSRCTAEVNTCFSDPTCNSWLACVYSCTTEACTTACDTMYPSARPRFAPLYACQCAMCSSECAYANSCAH